MTRVLEMGGHLGLRNGLFIAGLWAPKGSEMFSKGSCVEDVGFGEVMASQIENP